MASFFRRLTKRFFIITNITLASLLLLSCANAFLHPGQWWLIALLGLLFPLLVLLVFGFLIFWTLIGSRWAFVSLMALILSWPNLAAFYAWNFSAGFKAEKQPSAVRILSWNVHYFDQMYRQGQQQQSQRIPIINFLKQQDADVLCLQEFFESNSPGYDSNINYIKQNLDYPYHYFVDDYRLAHNLYKVGPVIFSRYPIISTQRLEFDGAANMRLSESLISADLNVHGDTIRIYTTHLQSVMFRRRDYQYIEKIKKVEDSLLEASKSIVKKLRQAYSIRGSQAESVRHELDNSPYPSVLCGDFNDVPNSYTYFRIRGGMQDAFISRGAGIGRTYSSISPTLRIDYIFADDRFSIDQCKKVELSYSDHYPVIADLILRNEGKAAK
ncbi:MAG TPA: endonuclease/exonuclease/phosphatase family protein [Chitinophagaceae bacterium]|nr:endonuclease/exonuclease/phosphatase family protein [Chitinophagaceae bacterium]